jgi:2-(3-amino-3-carboxypropyl)histidine synthase
VQEYYLLGTIQFNTAIFDAQERLLKIGYTNVRIPQEKPRSSGEVLGCTSPSLANPTSPVIFVCDGRFHMEASMIANPHHNFYQYNPYTRELTIERYDHKELMRRREEELARAAFGTLGRQGNIGILNRMRSKVSPNYDYFIILVSEVNDHLLKLLKDKVDFFVQVSCPRLSIDWGYKSAKPLLTPYEFFVLMGMVEWKQTYPMDYYSNNGGEWTNYFGRSPKSTLIMINQNPPESNLPLRRNYPVSDTTLLTWHWHD